MTDTALIVAAVVLAVLAFAAFAALVHFKQKTAELAAKYGPAEAALTRAQQEAAKVMGAAKAEASLKAKAMLANAVKETQQVRTDAEKALKTADVLREEAIKTSAAARDAAIKLEAETKEKAEKVKAQLAAQAQQAQQALEEKKAALAGMTEHVNSLEVKSKSLLKEQADLAKEVASLSDDLNVADHGLYKPHFDFDTSEKYKAALVEVVAKRAQMVKDGRAATSGTAWSKDGSREQGAKMIAKALQTMLRAFNGDVAVACSDVRWNNVSAMEARIERSFKALNKAGETMTYAISCWYKDLALEELRLTHERQEKLHEEREEQKRINEQMREEARAVEGYERAQREAANEEARYVKALAKARAELGNVAADKLATLNGKVEELEAALAEAHAKGERAKSMAEQTKTGFVYVISNVGSFGEDFYKIGLSRRLDPMERIDELSNASVPFRYDVHAMMRSEDAPALEAAFHKRFNEGRVNLANSRKEFFKVTLAEVEAFAKEQGVKVEFTKTAEAREWRETQALRAEKAAQTA